MAKLTPKQKRFVAEYLVDLNATQAAIRAGYSGRTAEQIGYQLLQKTSVSSAIQEAMQKRAERVEITQDYVISGLCEVAERCMQRAPVLTKKGEQVVDEDGHNLWEFDGKTACRAFELLGKHLGMFSDKAQIDVRTLVVDFGAEDGS